MDFQNSIYPLTYSRAPSTVIANASYHTGVREDVSTLSYFLKTLMLFTLSDLNTFVIPESAFGLFGALSGPVMTTNRTADLLTIGLRVPHVVLLILLNSPLFTVSNQRLPDAVKEDAINKPYRPLAAGGIAGFQAMQLLLMGIPIVLYT